MYKTLIAPEELASRLGGPDIVIVDCRTDLMRPGAGRAAYDAAHIPRAVFADLETDLSGPPVTNQGRHPLPTPTALTETFSRLGIDHRVQVVGYDDAGGSIAARLWWLLRYMGHSAVAVLDGGWQAWVAGGYPTESGQRSNAPRRFSGAPREDWVVTVDQVPQSRLLIDARDPPRYRGEVEPLDPVAGHIPGARNLPWKSNLGEDGRFLQPGDLRSRLQTFLGGVPAEEVVCYCGSGVTACHDILALEHAGLGTPKLYGGSWSEWCKSSERPVSTGDA